MDPLERIQQIYVGWPSLAGRSQPGGSEDCRIESGPASGNDGSAADRSGEAGNGTGTRGDASAGGTAF